MSKTSVLILRQPNPILNFPPYFSQIHFNIIFPYATNNTNSNNINSDTISRRWLSSGLLQGARW